MYTKILKSEIISTILPKDFPSDRLSKPQYKMVVERDVFVTGRLSHPRDRRYPETS